MIDDIAPFGEDGVVFTIRSDRHLVAALDAVRASFPSSVSSAGRRRVLTTHLPGSPRDAARSLAELGPLTADVGSNAKEVLVPVVYDGDDLADIAARTGLGVDAIIARHTARSYEVSVIGFLPGFAYLESLSPELVMDRLDSPRRRVPAMSVAIAGSMTAIYPFASAGGWRLIGRADLPSLFDVDRDPPGLLQRGDRVRFHPIDRLRTPLPSSIGSEREASAADLIVVRAPAAASVQDLGRPSARASGVPASGPLDVSAMMSANRGLGNPTSAATIEVPLGRFELRALRPLDICADGEAPRRLAADESFVVSSNGRAVRYLALAGGVDVPAHFGSRSTLAVASLGGHEGRFLRRGDLLSRSTGAAGSSTIDPAALRSAARVDHETDADAPIEILRAPTLEDARVSAQSFDELIRGEFHVGLGDRMGVRLDGTKVHRASREDRGSPEPTVRGVVQLTSDGTPIVLGPDAAVTGGYPIVGVLGVRAQMLLARKSPGDRVRFRPDDRDLG